MIKNYLTYLFVLLSAPLIAQGFEDFSNLNEGGTYVDGSFVGNDGITWAYGHARNEGSYSIDGEGLMLRRASDSYLEVTLADGVDNFSFEYRKAFTGASERQLEVLVNGVQRGLSPTFGNSSGEDATVFTLSLTGLNEPGPVTIRIKNVGTTSTNRQVTLDNITWTSFTLSSGNQEIQGFKLYPNPVTNGKITISTQKNLTKQIAIYDILGKQVLSQKITSNQLSVASLSKGVYLLKVTEENKTTVRKLIVQ